MLHIHNGDSTADTAKQSSLPGRHLAWRESLITGPTPYGLSADEWRLVRARHLSEGYGVDLQNCERDLLSQEATLASFSEHDEVVLWFEHDLFCQVHLLYLLDWFSQRELGNTTLSLICVGVFPGKDNFRGLGELNAEQLATLFPARQKLTSPQLRLASSAWQAYCSSNPKDIENILQADTSPLPFLRAALEAHLRRFPSTWNGLGRIENRALQLIDQGRHGFTDLFRHFGDAEPIYGFGDAQFCLALLRVAGARKSLLTIENNANQRIDEQGQKALTPERVRHTGLELSEFGRSVLKGETDFVMLNGIDIWLGGVHLHDPNNLWRWHESSRRLRFTGEPVKEG
jgi:hypothetical protein